jgi:hypothetical protein
VTICGSDDRGSIAGRRRDIFVCHYCTHRVVLRVPSVGGKLPEFQADHSPSSSSEAKNAWSFISAPLIRLTVLCLLDTGGAILFISLFQGPDFLSSNLDWLRGQSTLSSDCRGAGLVWVSVCVSAFEPTNGVLKLGRAACDGRLPHARPFNWLQSVEYYNYGWWCSGRAVQGVHGLGPSGRGFESQSRHACLSTLSVLYCVVLCR